MKKQLAMLLSAVLCATSLMLGACGGSSAPADEAETKTEATATKKEEKKDPKEKFVGDWKIACVEMNGLKITGDLSQMFETEEGMALSLDKDGTGTMNYTGETAKITWTLDDKDENTISIVATENEDAEPIPAKYDEKNSALAVTMSDDEMEGTMYFTADGTIADAMDLDFSKAEAITSLDDLKGTWKMTGVGMMDMIMYGDPDDLAALIGEDYDASMTIDDEGNITVSGEDGGTVTIDENGASMGASGTELSVPLKKLDNYLIMDMGDLLGTSLCVIYTK